MSEHKEADERREAALLKWGIRVLRYSNDSIRNNFVEVTEDILKNIELDPSSLKDLK